MINFLKKIFGFSSNKDCCVVDENCVDVRCNNYSNSVSESVDSSVADSSKPCRADNGQFVTQKTKDPYSKDYLESLTNMKLHELAGELAVPVLKKDVKAVLVDKILNRYA